MREKAIICDLDGTLADIKHRDPFDASACLDDAVNKPIKNLINQYFNAGYKVIILSGRMDKYKKISEQWLLENNIHYNKCYLRKTGDGRKDSIIKKEIYLKDIMPRYSIEFILDDRNQVVDMWRKELKLVCFQVNYGDF